MAPLIRQVTLTIQPGQRFGFDLVTAQQDDSHAMGQYICGVDAGSPAARNGLLPGDYLLKVGPVVVTSHSHGQVVELIKACGNTVDLTVESAAMKIMSKPILLTKVRGGLYKRMYYLSRDGTRVCWSSKSKNKLEAMFRVGDIKEIRIGRKTTTFQRAFDKASVANKEELGGEGEFNCFSIVIGEDFETLDFVAPDEQSFHAWTLGLKSLAGKAAALEKEVDGRISSRDAWLREIFERGDVNGDKELSLSEVKVLMQKLNLNIPGKALRRKFYEADMNKGKKEEGHNMLDFNEFKTFYKSLATRTDLGEVMLKYGSAEIDRSVRVADKFDSFDDVTLNAKQLMTFLTTDQSMNCTVEQAAEFIELYEPAPEMKQAGTMGIEGFTRFMLGEEGDAFNPLHKRQVYQDMSQPLTHYFIASSHNTYLMEDQLRGPSDVEAYVRALLMGCRCVELDCWDGDDGEPIIYHGHTLTSKIRFRDVIKACKQYGFATSDFPLILSLENHCSVPQQKKMAEYLVESFGDAIYKEFDPERRDFPSPLELKRKVLVKGKRLPASAGNDEDVSDEDEAEEAMADDSTFKNQPPAIKKNLKIDKTQAAAAKKHKLAHELSDLVTYCQSVKFKGFQSDLMSLPFYHICSFGETKARDLATDPTTGKKFLDRNKRQLARTYPAGFRVTSTNYEPQEMWNAGCQVVALNYQTHCHEMNINQGKFRDNGGCGYLLKPQPMRSLSSHFDPNDPSSLDPAWGRLLSIRIISGQHLPKPESEANGEIIDPYVTCEVVGLAMDNQKLRTKTIDNNGFNPRWDEVMEFDVSFPDNAVVYFKIYDDDSMSGDDLIAQTVIPFHSLRPGFRHLQLRAKSETPLSNSSLFVHITISEIGRSKLARQQSGALFVNHSKDPIARTKIAAIDGTFDQAPIVDANDMRESFLVSTERFKQQLELPLTASIETSMFILQSRVNQLGGRLELETHNSAGNATFQLAQVGLTREQVVDKSIDRPLRSYESMRNAIESIFKSHDDLSARLKRSLNDMEKFLVPTELEAKCKEANIKGVGKQKAKQALEKQIIAVREAILLNETNVSNCKSIMQSVKRVIVDGGDPAGIFM